MVGVAARPLDADHARRHAVVVQAFAAARAFTAARPWIDETIGADGRIACLRPSSDNSAERLMAQRHPQHPDPPAPLPPPAPTHDCRALPRLTTTESPLDTDRWYG